MIEYCNIGNCIFQDTYSATSCNMAPGSWNGSSLPCCPYIFAFPGEFPLPFLYAINHKDNHEHHLILYLLCGNADFQPVEQLKQVRSIWMYTMLKPI